MVYAVFLMDFANVDTVGKVTIVIYCATQIASVGIVLSQQTCVCLVVRPGGMAQLVVLFVVLVVKIEFVITTDRVLVTVLLDFMIESAVVVAAPIVTSINVTNQQVLQLFMIL